MEIKYVNALYVKRTVQTVLVMDNKKLKRASLINLITGYGLVVLFFILILFNRAAVEEEIVLVDTVVDEKEMFIDKPEVVVEKEIVYIDSAPHNVVREFTPYRDRLTGVIIDTDPTIVVDDIDPHVAIVTGTDHVIVDNDRDVYINNGRDVVESEVYDRVGDRHYDNTHVDSHVLRDDIGIVDRVGRGNRHIDVDDDVDLGLLDRRIREENIQTKDTIGITDEDKNINLSNLTLARDEDTSELGDIDVDFESKAGKGYGVGKGGQLYAYNFPSRGVGAGIGNGSIGAGAGGSAGLGAGIGEGMLNGETVPTLGGVGTYISPSSPGSGLPGEAPTIGGVGGLVGGAGAGGAAGLTTGMVMEKLGIGPGGPGAGYGNGGRGKYNYDHLPQDGALHIMMHVDGSGSILNTRKQLDIMKDTILKDALLPYYNNDEGLYNRRVTIVSSSGERTLKFFTEAAKKDNVLAIAFQDEAQPSYHLPTFNKKPQDHYSKDIGNLKASLNGYSGLYRGVMFQVDRGKTFAKSFKEFVESAWRGQGYLESSNLKRYYKDNNTHHIRNRDGIVFSDEYHAKDAGDPQYYLDLIFDASKKVGLDLNIYAAGLTDGKKTSSID